MEISQLHEYSLGLVSSIKAIGSKEIEVIPIEVRMTMQEEVVSGDNEQTATFATNDGGEDNIKVTINNYVKATWINLNSNRVTAPDVRRGDMVMIYQLGDSEKYFWMDYNSKGVKRLETVTYAFSADRNKPMAEDLSNAYYIQFSTHGKAITLHTSQADGEPYGYDIQLNTADGIFQMIDTDNNTIWLDSKNREIGMLNADKTKFVLAKKNIVGYAPDSMKFTAVNNIDFKCKDYKIVADNSVTVNTKKYSLTASDSVNITTKDYQLNAGASVNITTATFTAKASSTTFTCPATTFTGVVNAAGLSVAPGAGGAGACNIGGPLTAMAIQCTSITAGTITATSGQFQALTHGGPPCC